MTTARRSVFGALAFAVVSTAGACSDSLAPADISGVYALESREGVRLPTLIHEGDAADIFLMSETLILRADRSGLRAVVQEYRRIGGDTETVTWERELSFDIRRRPDRDRDDLRTARVVHAAAASRAVSIRARIANADVAWSGSCPVVRSHPAHRHRRRTIGNDSVAARAVVAVLHDGTSRANRTVAGSWSVSSGFRIPTIRTDTIVTRRIPG